MTVKTPMIERLSEVAFFACCLGALYLAFYWGGPLTLYDEPGSGKAALSTWCQQAPDCKSAYPENKVDAVTGRPVYVAKVHLRNGRRRAEVAEQVGRLLHLGVESSFIANRYVLGVKGVAVEVTHD